MFQDIGLNDINRAQFLDSVPRLKTLKVESHSTQFLKLRGFKTLLLNINFIILWKLRNFHVRINLEKVNEKLPRKTIKLIKKIFPAVIKTFALIKLCFNNPDTAGIDWRHSKINSCMKRKNFSRENHSILELVFYWAENDNETNKGTDQNSKVVISSQSFWLKNTKENWYEN